MKVCHRQGRSERGEAEARGGQRRGNGYYCVVVVYHVTIVTIGHGLLKKFWPLVLGCVLRTAYFVLTTQLLPHPGHE